MPLAHAAHQLVYAGPALLALVAVALLTWRSSRRARREPLVVLADGRLGRSHLEANQPREEVDTMSASKQTTDHDTIRRWVEERGGRPAQVKGTGSAEDPGVLRIDYPGRGEDAALEPVDWDAWFAAFEENELAFLYQDETDEGGESRFSKLVSRAGEG